MDAHGARTRERLEKALDTLLQDAVISGWQYDRWHETDADLKGWATRWMQATILIEPPELIREQYKKLERLESSPRQLPPHETLGQLMERRRKALGWTQCQAAEAVGVSQSYWSVLASGRKTLDELSASLRRKLEAWLSGQA